MHHLDHSKNIIELHNISFAYEGEPVLTDVSFNIHLGDFLGIVGPNGGGKTTLLKIILGLLKPSRGQVCIFDQDQKDFHDWPKIGYVPQKVTSFDINFPATVAEVVAMGRFGKKGLLHNLHRSDFELISKAIEEVGMSQYRHRLIGDLSGGQQQRVFIARALASNPQVILLDEPTVGVDLPTQEAFYQLLEKLNKELDITLVLVSHDVDVVAHETTEIACINKRLVYHGSPKEFIKENYLENLYGKGVKFILHDH